MYLVTRGPEADVVQLAELFAAQSGNKVSAQVSSDLALDIVLNEILEQACEATGATGAAVMLERDGEMICRAMSGGNAPELGTRLDSEFGLTAHCVRTREAQYCDDAETDPRADAEASRRLGVRSVIVLPLLREKTLSGVLEVFSSQPAAFTIQDQRVLESVADRIVKNLELSEQVVGRSLRSAGQRSPDQSSPDQSSPEQRSAAQIEYAPELNTSDDQVRAQESVQEANAEIDRNGGEEVHPAAGLEPEETTAATVQTGVSALTASLAAACVICTVAIVALLILRVALHRSPASHLNVTTAASQTAEEANASPVPTSNAPAEGEKTGPPLRDESTAQHQPLAPGSLAVYENDKEVFRLPATDGKESAIQAFGRALDPSASAKIVELSPRAVQSSLVHRVEPEYPEDARKQGIQGAVVMDVRINSNGTVEAVNVVSGPDALAQAAMAAVKHWQFRPRMLNGHAVEMQTRVTLDFRLPR
jgi:TonB family protein